MTTEDILSTLTTRAKLDAELHLQQLGQSLTRCKGHLADEVYNLKRRRFSVDHPDVSDDLEEVSLDTDEEVDAYLDLIAQAVREDASKLSDIDWLHMRTFLSTYLSPRDIKKELTGRFHYYLTLVNGDIKLFTELFGYALDIQFTLPKGKRWDPRVTVTEDDFAITFFWKNVQTA